MSKNFNEYMFERLIEQVNNNEIILMLSTRFKVFLGDINHPIAKRLLNAEYDSDITTKKTFIDLDDSGTDMISFIN